MIVCDWCRQPFDPVGCRWRCPGCGYKAIRQDVLALLEPYVFHGQEDG